MPWRNGKFYLVVLITVSLGSSFAADESGSEHISTVDEITVDDRIIEMGNRSEETISEKPDTKATSKNKGAPVKMIVGGQSTDGQAKEVTLPVVD